MSDRRRQSLCRPTPPERTRRHARRSLRSRQYPARAIAPSRGLFFHSEVQCLDVVSTESRSPALRAACRAARGTSTKPASSVRSSTLPCAIVADAASTALFLWRSKPRRSITYTRSRKEGRTLPATWSRPVRRAIGSRATCFRTSSSDDTHGREQTSSVTHGQFTGP
jgi:hypothetical protein